MGRQALQLQVLPHMLLGWGLAVYILLGPESILLGLRELSRCAASPRARAGAGGTAALPYTPTGRGSVCTPQRYERSFGIKCSSRPSAATSWAEKLSVCLKPACNPTQLSTFRRRYIGSLVGDFHRMLLHEGILLKPCKDLKSTHYAVQVHRVPGGRLPQDAAVRRHLRVPRRQQEPHRQAAPALRVRAHVSYCRAGEPHVKCPVCTMHLL